MILAGEKVVCERQETSPFRYSWHTKGMGSLRRPRRRGPLTRRWPGTKDSSFGARNHPGPNTYLQCRTGGTLDISTAARGELMRILDTGEHYANLIIENRPCDGLSGLPRVPAIGSSHYENFRVWVNVECWNGY